MVLPAMSLQQNTFEPNTLFRDERSYANFNLLASNSRPQPWGLNTISFSDDGVVYVCWIHEGEFESKYEEQWKI